jgi:hypothetical protein
VPPFHEELLVPFPPTLADEPMMTHARGTLILASRKSLERRGWFERYKAHLPSQHELTIASSTASTWLPVDVALAHYRACEALGLSEDEQLALGAAVVHALQKTFLGSVVRTASKGTGLSPLPALQKFFHLYARSFKGGGSRMVRIGPKDVRAEFVGNQAAAIRYFRVAYRGFITAGCETFAQRVVTAELGAYASPTSVAYRIAWV